MDWRYLKFDIFENDQLHCRRNCLDLQRGMFICQHGFTTSLIEYKPPSMKMMLLPRYSEPILFAHRKLVCWEQRQQVCYQVDDDFSLRQLCTLDIPNFNHLNISKSSLTERFLFACTSAGLHVQDLEANTCVFGFSDNNLTAAYGFSNGCSMVCRRNQFAVFSVEAPYFNWEERNVTAAIQLSPHVVAIGAPRLSIYDLRMQRIQDLNVDNFVTGLAYAPEWNMLVCAEDGVEQYTARLTFWDLRKPDGKTWREPIQTTEEILDVQVNTELGLLGYYSRKPQHNNTQLGWFRYKFLRPLGSSYMEVASPF
eukprot:GILJ01012760.1.p1 GENE.GILJ01012760.1~~GILJ01012760.1.p1  ORF type:complete len:363 (+),score=31.78 GILJ01012760.1:161-1090(+)